MDCATYETHIWAIHRGALLLTNLSMNKSNIINESTLCFEIIGLTQSYFLTDSLKLKQVEFSRPSPSLPPLNTPRNTSPAPLPLPSNRTGEFYGVEIYFTSPTQNHTAICDSNELADTNTNFIKALLGVELLYDSVFHHCLSLLKWENNGSSSTIIKDINNKFYISLYWLIPNTFYFQTFELRGQIPP